MRHGSLKVLCNCKHEFQDAEYGVGVRVANPVNKSRTTNIVKEVRCTVCSKSHTRFTER